MYVCNCVFYEYSLEVLLSYIVFIVGATIFEPALTIYFDGTDLGSN